MIYTLAPGGGITLTAPSVTLASLTGLMSRFTSRPVVDLTGIEGQYSFSLTFAPETTENLPSGAFTGADAAETAADPAPSVFDAVKPYGFRLEVRKAPIEILTVLHVEKTPTEN